MDLESPSIMIGVINNFLRQQGLLGHDLRVPVGCPPFIHDLGLTLRQEIVGLLANDRQYLFLPILKWGILNQKREDIAHWLFRKLSFLKFCFLDFSLLVIDKRLWIDIFIHVRFAFDLFDDGDILLLLL